MLEKAPWLLEKHSPFRERWWEGHVTPAAAPWAAARIPPAVLGGRQEVWEALSPLEALIPDSWRPPALDRLRMHTPLSP